MKTEQQIRERIKELENDLKELYDEKTITLLNPYLAAIHALLWVLAGTDDRSR